jgi:transcriptional regulator with XRE-family HTH domain
MKLAPYNKTELGVLLRRMRIRSRLTQEDVSKRLSLSSSQFVSNIERGTCVIPIGSLKIMLDLYKVDPRNMIGNLAIQYRRYLLRILK